MIRPIRSALLLASAVLLAACSGNSSNGPTGSISVLHASSNAPAVNVLFNGVEAFPDLNYKEVQGDPNASATSYPVRVDAILADGSTANVIPGAMGDDPVVPLERNAQVTVIAYGDVGSMDRPLTATVATDPAPEVPSTDTRLQVFHAATNVSFVQVWVTAPGADLDPSDPSVVTAGFDYGTFLTPAPLQVPAGDYQIRVTPSISDTTVVYDTGTITLPGGANLVVAAVPNTGAQNTGGDTAPIQLIASTGAALLEFLDINTISNVNVVHASSDAPAVDVAVDGTVAITGLEFLETTEDPASLAPGPVTFEVFASPAASNPDPVITAETSLVQGESATVLAVGSLSLDPENPIEAIIVPETTRAIATEALVRIIHASVIAQDVNIYVEDGGTLPLSGDIPNNVSPALSDVPFKAATDYLTFEPGRSYDIAITQATSQTPAIGPLTITFDAGSIQTIVAHDGVNLDPAGLNVLLLDY